MDQPSAYGANWNAAEFRERFKDALCDDLVLAIVGQVGSGTSVVAKELCKALNASTFKTGDQITRYRVDILKASDAMCQASNIKKGKPEEGPSKLRETINLQNLGDSLRKSDKSKIAQIIIQNICEKRRKVDGQDIDLANAWIIDSLRHPEEVRLFRSIYGEGFLLVGVVCSHDERQRRLRHKYSGSLPELLNEFMQRDEGDEENGAGQQVAKAFQLADVYVDNSELNEASDQPNSNWRIPEDLRRFADLVMQTKVIPPTTEETAMHAAYGAAMRSACLSRQVGAALVDSEGRLISTGCNDVPKPGGGLYGEGLAKLPIESDSRCFAFAGKGAYCRNNREQQEMISDIAGKLIERFSSYFRGDVESEITKRNALVEALQDSRITALTEFSRAVHAEMDALLAAARQGISPTGTSLFVTTFPCHNCARHIVVAGVREVQYIEPYRKSQATRLHDDAITMSAKEAKDSGKVLFRPFVGVAPRRYRQFFYNERKLKNEKTGERIRPVEQPAWGRPYQQIEAARGAAENLVDDR